MTTVARRPRLLGLVMVSVLAIAGIVPTPAGVDAAPRHTVDVARAGDWVPQTNFVQCVGASMQMMVNMIEPGRDRSARTQRRLQDLAREWSGRRPDGGTRQGASVRGWAAGLNILGAGPYKLAGEPTLEAAMRTAARAIEATGKPVGLLVWRGRHAWVMSGFVATGPMDDPDSRVTRAIVHDPLYPHGSAAWGPSPEPGAALTMKELGRQFVQRRRSSWSSMPGMPASQLGGMYVLVLPYTVDVEAHAATLR
jgi:hypothetical protein